MLSDALDLPKAFGPYTLLRRLAVGGMAEVYVAKTKGIGGFEKLIAIKVIHPRFSEDDHFIQMLVEEAKISVQLSHVNIAQTFDLGCIDDTYFIAMEYIEGADTYRVGKRTLEKAGPLPIDICCYIGAEICHGLGYAHRKRDPEGRPMGIVHRDISPQNVLISYAGEVKLVDFGIAKAALRTAQTEVGVIKGKYYYMSPEQAWGDPVDQRSDVFSTGLLLHELLTGEMVYKESSVPALLDLVRKADIAGPRARRAEIPPELDRVLMRALAKEPDDRYQSAHALAQDLTEILYRRSPAFTAAKLATLMAQLFPNEAKRTSQITRVPTEPPRAPEVALESMSRAEFAPAAESSVIFDLDGATSDRTRNDILPFRRTDGGSRETRRIPSDSGTQTATGLQDDWGDDWEEETFLKDRASWDESTLVDEEGELFADALRLMGAPSSASVEELEGEATVATDRPILPLGRRGPTVPLSKTGLPSVSAAAPARPAPAPRPATPRPRLVAAARPAVDAGLETDTRSTLDMSPFPPLAELEGEKTTTLADLPDRSSWSESGPSAGGIRLGPQAERYFNTPSGGGVPMFESPPPAGPTFAPPPAADPFAPPPPVVTAPHPAQLGKPQPLRWLLLVGAVIAAILLVVAGALFAFSGPEPTSLEILSEPEGARVTLDGVPLAGPTPVSVAELEPGRVARVELELEGYEPRAEDVQLAEGENRRLLVLSPVQITLRIETDPPGAQVWIDDVHRGNSPLDVTLSVGQSVAVRARAPGRRETSQQVTADPGARQRRLRLELPPR